MNFENELKEGMTVYSSDGKKLGVVIGKSSAWFSIEKGFFFPKDYYCRYDFISALRGDECWLNTTGEALMKAPPAEGRAAARQTSGEMRIPLAEEELEAGRRTFEAGEVRIHKDVVSETKEVSVPLHHEEVRVERVEASPENRTPGPGEATFQKETTTIPVFEEEVEIRKRPVVREELRVSKEGFTEERRASENVRKETAEVEEDRLTDPDKNR